MKIAIDIDEVLADFANPFDKFIQKKYGLTMDRDKWNTEEWWKAWGGSKITAVGKIYEFVGSGALEKLSLIAGAKDGVQQLKKQGHDLIIITGRAADWMDTTRAWLDKNFFNTFSQIESTDFHVAKGGYKTKGIIAHDLGCDILIDDFPHYAEEAIANGVKVLLFDTGFNHIYKEHDDIHRVKNWKEVLVAINKINNIK